MNPTQRQLDDLLASLNTPPSCSSSAFSGARNRLIEPFGPIKKRSYDHTSLDPVQTPDAPITRVGRGAENRRGEKDWDEMGYTKALPIISGLLDDEEVKKELKKVCQGFARRLHAERTEN